MSDASPLAVLAPDRESGSRFGLVSYLPTYAGILVIYFLIAMGATSGPVDIASAYSALQSLSASGAIILAISTLLVAVLLHPLQLPLVRILEGYWPMRWPGSRIVRSIAVWRQRSARNRLVTRAEIPNDADREALARAFEASWELGQRFPPENEQLMPTALGNVLRAAELAAGSPYGADAVVWWPRVYPTLRTSMKHILDDRRIQLDVTCRISAVLVVIGLASAVLLKDDGWWLAIAPVSLVFAWIAYRASIAAAVSFGESMRAAFDLHRFDVLNALHLELPDTSAAEIVLNRRITSLWAQNVPMGNISYSHVDRKGDTNKNSDTDTEEA